ncbi:MAG: methylenetetrahydrofolate reductase C-terminal domain-containing protein [Gammaproteobacteria bacterium]
MRLWSVRHAHGLNQLYRWLENLLLMLQPLLRGFSERRVERSLAAVERQVKGFMFGCQMCGQCVLSSTGMSCPMNCPKQLRNGPCGGVRANGHCEVLPEMKCVWVSAWEGSQRIPGGVDALRGVQFAVDRRLQGSSSWLRAVNERARAASSARPGAGQPGAGQPGAGQ